MVSQNEAGPTKTIPRTRQAKFYITREGYFDETSLNYTFHRCIDLMRSVLEEYIEAGTDKVEFTILVDGFADQPPAPVET